MKLLWRRTQIRRQLPIFTRGVNIHFSITEESLGLQTLKGRTGSEDILEAISTVFKSFGLKWNQLTLACIDVVSAMVQTDRKDSLYQNCNRIKYPYKNIIKYKNIIEVA